ncbi:hypothetical protein Tco_0658675 [Tanacetum coccineum]
MDDPNITMEEYIWLEEEKARRRGKVFNWKTATYGKIWDNEDVHDLRFVETEFPAIVFNKTLTSEATLSCEPTVSSLNNDEIDFRISFDESDDEDCTPTVSYFDDLDFFKDFKKEFPAIVYNDAQTSKSDLLTEPILNLQHIDEFNLKDETSLSECDEEEQNILNFNDLFPFNVIYPDELKTDTDNDNDKVDIEHSSGDLSVKPLPDVINTDVGVYAHESNKLLETIYTAYSLNEDNVYDTGINTAYPGLEICTLQMEMYISSQSSCNFTTVTIIDETEGRRTTEEIIQNCYDREDGETTPRFECCKRRAFWSVNEDILKITILKTNTPYPSRRYGITVHALTKRPHKIKDQYAVSRGLNMPYSRYGINIIFWKISNVVPTLRNPQYIVRIMQISQENGQNRTNTDTGTDRVYKSREFDSKKGQKSTPVNL